MLECHKQPMAEDSPKGAERIRGIVFDLDGTLLDTLEDLATAFNLALKDVKGEVETYPSLADYQQYIGNGILNVGRKLHRHYHLPEESREDFAYRFVERYNGHYERVLQQKSRPYPGMLQVVDELAKRGYELCVLTNKPEPQAKILVKAFFDDWIPQERVFGMSLEREPKPALSFSSRILSVSSLPLRQWAMVGDSNVDIYTAQTAGMLSVGVSWGFRGAEELQAAGADYLVYSAQELLALFPSLEV